jgi:DNA-directed RNA polymerase specialized sigma24 family protein
MTRRTELADEIGNDTFAYHFGKSCEEIAASLGCPVSTVKTRMFYGRQKLKRLLPILAGRASADHS